MEKKDKQGGDFSFKVGAGLLMRTRQVGGMGEGLRNECQCCCDWRVTLKEYRQQSIEEEGARFESRRRDRENVWRLWKQRNKRVLEATAIREYEGNWTGKVRRKERKKNVNEGIGAAQEQWQEDSKPLIYAAQEQGTENKRRKI